jgi:hypothetical protein
MSDDDSWKSERDVGAADLTDKTSNLMAGKTIASVEVAPHDDESDCLNLLRVRFTDGTAVVISGGYGGYTGNSCDEYIELIYVRDEPH